MAGIHQSMSVASYWGRAMDRLSRSFMWVALLAGLLTYGCTYMANCFGPPVRADGAGYYIYLPSIALYGDPSFERVADEQYEGVIPEWTGVRRDVSTGRYANRYAPGTAIMMAPFFYLAHAMTACLGTPELDAHPSAFSYGLNYDANGYTFFYQHAAGLAGLFYVLAGLCVLRNVLRGLVGERIVLYTLLSILWGTNLFHYATGESVLSHPYSFFLFACLLALIPKWYDEKAPWNLSWALGLVIGLIALVRLPNLLVTILVPLYGITNASDLERRIGFYRKHLRQIFAIAMLAVCVFLPQVVLWKFATGHLIANVYGLQGEGFNFTDPQLVNVLFSLEGGALFWAPVLGFACMGLVPIYRRIPNWAVGVSVFVVANIYVISSWWMWSFGGGFGHRAFVESYAVLALPLASFYASVKRTWAKRVVTVVAIGAVGFTLFMMKLYYTREISYYGLDAQALYDIFWSRKQWLLQWFGG